MVLYCSLHHRWNTFFTCNRCSPASKTYEFHLDLQCASSSRTPLTTWDTSYVPDGRNLHHTQQMQFVNSNRRIITGLRNFLGLCNVLRRFVPTFARLAVRLNKRFRKDQLASFWPLSMKKSAVMNALKLLPSVHQSLHFQTKADILPSLHATVTFKTTTFLYKKLLDDTARSIRYWSRALSGAGKRYSSTKKKTFLAIA